MQILTEVRTPPREPAASREVARLLLEGLDQDDGDSYRKTWNSPCKTARPFKVNLLIDMFKQRRIIILLVGYSRRNGSPSRDMEQMPKCIAWRVSFHGFYRLWCQRSKKSTSPCFLQTVKASGEFSRKARSLAANDRSSSVCPFQRHTSHAAIVSYHCFEYVLQVV